MQRKAVYLAFLVAGIIIPMSAFVPWLIAHGIDGRLFVQELFATRISTFFALDLLLTAVCVLYFARRELRGHRFWWAPLAVTCLVGVSAGLPLLLYLREDVVDKP